MRPKLVVAIGLSVALPAIIDVVFNFKPRGGATPEGIIPRGNKVFYDVFKVYAFSRNELVAMGAAVLAMVVLAALFRFSALGLRMRAVVESPRMTELNGIDADRVSAFAWALSSLFAGLAGGVDRPTLQHDAGHSLRRALRHSRVRAERAPLPSVGRSARRG